jgi:hypothetical protein
MDTTELDWSNVAGGAEPEILRQAEACLTATERLAIAADQRATRLCGTFGGATVALLAGAMALIAKDSEGSLVAGLAATATLMFIACILAAVAARPRDFQVAGYEPRLLLPGCSNKETMIRFIVEDTQQCINTNRRALEGAATLLVSSLWVGGAAVLAGIGAFVIFRAANWA